MVTDLRVLVVADDPLARGGLATLLTEQPGVIVAGRVSGLDDLSAAVEIYRPDVLLLDLGWNPASTVERLGRLDTDAPVVALLADETHAAQVWAAGVRALLRRAAESDQLIAALAAVAHGLVVVDPAFAERLIEAPGASESARHLPLAEPLTPRELEVLRLLAEGLPNKTIASSLNISEHTVKFHVNAILGKLGVASRTEAVVRATRMGLILL